MEHHVVHATRRLGNEVRVLALGDDMYATLRRAEEARPHVVFNLTEHYGTNRRLVAQLPAMLEMFGLPFTGSSASGLALSCDKVLASLLVRDQGVRVPGFVTVPLGRTRPPRSLQFPLIVKPRFADGSEGISLGSIVHSPRALEERVRLVHRRLRQDAICQEYIDGRELSVGVLGNQTLLSFPPRETVFGMRDAGGPRISTGRAKESKAYSERWKISYARAELTPAQAQEAAHFAKAAYRCLGLSGYGRVDFRLDPEGRLFFLEANANPDLRPRVFGVMASWAGVDYLGLIQRILQLALQRSRSRVGPRSSRAAEEE
jgi:D-alanine-D-alanine ligase